MPHLILSQSPLVQHLSLSGDRRTDHRHIDEDDDVLLPVSSLRSTEIEPEERVAGPKTPALMPALPLGGGPSISSCRAVRPVFGIVDSLSVRRPLDNGGILKPPRTCWPVYPVEIFSHGLDPAAQLLHPPMGITSRLNEVGPNGNEHRCVLPVRTS
jgi:hypothetical protein